MKYLHLFVVALFLLSSCSEDPLSNKNSTSLGKPTLEIKPDSLNGFTYIPYDFLARVKNYIHDDVGFSWYFGEGDTTSRHSTARQQHRYEKAGTYIISVTAYDSFEDTVIDVQTVPVTITDTKPYVAITPGSTDTLIKQNINGKLDFLTFLAKTNLPSDIVSYHWHFSDGPQDTVTNSYPGTYHTFPSAGTYTVRVDVYDNLGAYWASDTVEITIRNEDISQTILSNSTQVVALLNAPTYLSDSLDFVQYIYSGVRKNKNSSTSYSVSGATLSCSTLDTTIWGAGYRVHSTTLNGELSSDLRSVEKISVQLWDSLYMSDSLYSGNIVSYDLKNISLLSVTDDYVVYLATKSPITSYVDNILINRLWTGHFVGFDSYGQFDRKPFDDLGYSALTGDWEYVLVIFSRK